MSKEREDIGMDGHLATLVWGIDGSDCAAAGEIGHSETRKAFPLLLQGPAAFHPLQAGQRCTTQMMEEADENIAERDTEYDVRR